MWLLLLLLLLLELRSPLFLTRLRLTSGGREYLGISQTFGVLLVIQLICIGEIIAPITSIVKSVLSGLASTLAATASTTSALTLFNLSAVVSVIGIRVLILIWTASIFFK